jgi:hypothetical protein
MSTHDKSHSHLSLLAVQQWENDEEIIYFTEYFGKDADYIYFKKVVRNLWLRTIIYATILMGIR